MARKETSRGAIIAIQIVSVFLIIVLLIYITIVILVNRTEPVISTCPVGTCPANFFTGERDCSTQEFDVGQEVCAPLGECTTRAPCAIQEDGGSDCGTGGAVGQCPASNPECNCVTDKLCPDYVMTYFNERTFTPELNEAPQRYYIQNSSYVDLINRYRWDHPLSAGASTNPNLCSVDEATLASVTNKSCLLGQITQIITPSGILFACTNSQLTCSAGQLPTVSNGVFRCQSGRPAFWVGA